MNLKTLFFFTCLIVASAIVYGSENFPKKKKHPNILLIEVDDLNFQYLSSNGSTLLQTPNVDKLAEEGVKFTNAVCQGMMCSPSRNSLITGLYPHNLGFYNNGEMKALPEGIWTFPKALQEAGYYTSWIGKCHIRPGGKDKTQAMKDKMGFDYVKQTEGRVVITKKAKKNREKALSIDWYLQFLNERGLVDHFLNEYPGISTLPEEAYLDRFFTSEAESFLSAYNEKEPFFLWLNYSVPHGPEDVMQKYHDPFRVEDMPGTTKANFEAPEMLVKGAKLSTNEHKHKVKQAGQCAMISFMDEQVGIIIDALKKSGQYENTLIVFFSDHGIMLGDHQRNHKGTLFRQITNPTLIVSYPKQFNSGTAVDAPVELLDIIQTLFDVAGRPELNQSEYSNSMIPLLKGKSESIREIAFGEIDGYVMATDGHYRLIKGEDATLLFDDISDPKNLHDISAEHPEKVQFLELKIEEWLKNTGPVLPKNTY
jgi:arylsulfatase A-like enzyme